MCKTEVRNSIKGRILYMCINQPHKEDDAIPIHQQTMGLPFLGMIQPLCPCHPVGSANRLGPADSGETMTAQLEKDLAIVGDNPAVVPGVAGVHRLDRIMQINAGGQQKQTYIGPLPRYNLFQYHIPSRVVFTEEQLKHAPYTA